MISTDNTVIECYYRMKIDNDFWVSLDEETKNIFLQATQKELQKELQKRLQTTLDRFKMERCVSVLKDFISNS